MDQSPFHSPMTLRVPLTDEELGTIVLALKLSKIRYGMLLQLAEQRGQTALSFETMGDLLDSLENVLRQRDSGTSR